MDSMASSWPNLEELSIEDPITDGGSSVSLSTLQRMTKLKSLKLSQRGSPTGDNWLLRQSLPK